MQTPVIQYTLAVKHTCAAGQAKPLLTRKQPSDAFPLLLGAFKVTSTSTTPYAYCPLCRLCPVSLGISDWGAMELRDSLHASGFWDPTERVEPHGSC